MQIPCIGRWLLLPCILQFAAGCSYVKSLFPDKERDYQFRNEIPELIIPSDLNAQKMPILPASTVSQLPSPSSRPVAVAAESQSTPQAEPQGATRPKPAAQTEPVNPPAAEERRENSDESLLVRKTTTAKADVSSLQIDQPKGQAWRLVARSLSRQKIEIVERNQDKGYFYVRYDPYAMTPETHSSFWDELDFIFGKDPSHEQEYRINLLEMAPQTTEVTVQNNEGQTLSDLTATHLLKLITDGINLDLPASGPENPAP